MVKKKHDLITKGLSSELFLLAFLEPDNIRKLAQRLQNTSGHPTNYSKASETVHNLTISKYLKYGKDEKYHPNILRIIDDFEAILQKEGDSFTTEEKVWLTRFLQNRHLLKILSRDIIEKIQNQPKGKHNVNALNVLCERIGATSAMWLLMRNTNPKFKKTFDNVKDLPYSKIEEQFDMFDALANEHSDELEKNMKVEFDKLIMPNKELFVDFFSGILKFMSSAMPLMMAPDQLLTKLSKLWNKYEGFQMAQEVYKFSKK